MGRKDKVEQLRTLLELASGEGNNEADVNVYGYDAEGNPRKVGKIEYIAIETGDKDSITDYEVCIYLEQPQVENDE